MDSTRARDIRVTIVEGMQLLGSFDARLREYAATKLHKQGVSLVKVPAEQASDAHAPPVSLLSVGLAELMKASTLMVGTGVIGVCPAEHGEGSAGGHAGAAEWRHPAIRHLCLVSRPHHAHSFVSPRYESACLRSGATPAFVNLVHQSALCW